MAVCGIVSDSWTRQETGGRRQQRENPCLLSSLSHVVRRASLTNGFSLSLLHSPPGAHFLLSFVSGDSPISLSCRLSLSSHAVPVPVWDLCQYCSADEFAFYSQRRDLVSLSLYQNYFRCKLDCLAMELLRSHVLPRVRHGLPRDGLERRVEWQAEGQSEAACRLVRQLANL